MACLKALILCIIITNSINCDKISEIDTLRRDFTNLEKDLWEKTLDSTKLDPNDRLSVETAGIKIIKRFKKFDNRIKELYPHGLEYGLEFLQKLWSWEIIRTYELSNVYNFYETFRRVQLRQIENAYSLSPEETWIEFSEPKIHDFQFSGVSELGNRIQEIVFNEQLFELTLKEANSDLCNLRQSPQQLLFNLYSTLALTELKGYSMMQFSYMLMKLYNKGNMTREVEVMRKGYEDRSRRMIRAIKSTMQDASRDLWICDPKRHIRGETYIEVTQLLQGYIENEVDLNSDGTCRETCDYYSYTENYGCFKDLYCSKQRKCKGKIINCKYYDADMWVCPSNTSSGRRYDYIEYENGRVLGKKGYCQKGTIKVDSWWRWLFWRCSYCFCLCEEQGVNSDRYFNLRNVIADVGNNRVVTGLRFVKENRIIHLQIQQGELLPKGRINEATLEWVPVDKYSILDNGVISGEDYHTLTWESRAIDLDDLETKPNHVVTGVRFRKVGSHLNFEIQSRPFNFTTGLLVDPKNQYEWISNDNTDASLDNPRRQLRLNNPDVPTKFRISSAPDSQSNQFLHFTNTAIDKDAAQTTVPFLDAQSVVSQIPVPLSGAGIYHKGQLGSGGFIAPKIKTFDFTPYIIEPPKIFYLKDSKNGALITVYTGLNFNRAERAKIHNKIFLINLITIYFLVN